MNLCGNVFCKKVRTTSTRPRSCARGYLVRLWARLTLISHEVLVKSLRKSQIPHTSVHSSFIITNVKNKFTDWCGSWLLQNDLINTFCARGYAYLTECFRHQFCRVIPPTKPSAKETGLWVSKTNDKYWAEDWVPAGRSRTIQKLTISARGTHPSTLG